MALDTVFSGGDDGFLTSLAGDMEDLFSDDLLNFLDTDYGSLALAQASLACPLDATPPSFLATAAAVISAGSACASPAHSSGNSSPSNMGPASTPVGLPIQRCAGPPTAPKNRGPVRLVTTELPPAEVKILQEPKCSFPRIEENASPSASVHQSEDECDSDDSEDTGEYDGLDGSGISKKSNKRKAPEVDWRAIADPSERRRQRRLAKNRVTAARSRERKKVQWADMEAKLSNLNNDNKRLKAMLEQLSRENTVLRGQLASTQGDGSGRMGRGNSQGTEPAALVFISILLLLCCSLPSDQAMLLGSAAPLLLLAQMLSSGADGQSLSDALLRFLSSLKMLLSRSSKRLCSSVHRLLYKRPHHMGRKALRDTCDWASSLSCSLLQPRIDVLSKIKVKDEPDYDVPFFPFLLGNGGC